jgi:methionyl aminopeptidase
MPSTQEKSTRELDALRRVGSIVRLTLDAMHANVRPGVTTREIDAIGAAVLQRHGARSAPKLVYGFPGSVCISINDEIVHGVPGDRIIQQGDLVKLDVTAEKGGFMADAAVTVPVAPVSEEAIRLVACVRNAFQKALEVMRAGNPVNGIGRAIEAEVTGRGFSVIPQFTGHGIGRSLHEEPCVPNFFDPELDGLLTEGMVLAIEPIITAGSGLCMKAEDGWTHRTCDGRRSAHYEHTIVVTSGSPVILTS